MMNAAECQVVKECFITGFDVDSRTNTLTVRTLNGDTHTVHLAKMIGMEKLGIGNCFYFNQTIFEMSEINELQRLINLKAFL